MRDINTRPVHFAVGNLAAHAGHNDFAPAGEAANLDGHYRTDPYDQIRLSHFLIDPHRHALVGISSIVKGMFVIPLMVVDSEPFYNILAKPAAHFIRRHRPMSTDTEEELNTFIHYLRLAQFF